MSEEMTGLSAVGNAQNDPILMPVMSIAQAKEQLERLQEFVKEVMVRGEDYGVVPGTENKPTLLKPGAEKLCELYGLAPTIKDIVRVEDWDRGFFHYEVRMQLISKRTGVVVAEGVGSANSKESKYSARWVPEWKLRNQDVRGLQWREKTNQRGGYREYRIPNEDPCNLVNTILKMAKKRALVDAVLSATCSSGLFTQDVEDLDESGEGSEVQVGVARKRPQAREEKTNHERHAHVPPSYQASPIQAGSTQASPVQASPVQGDPTRNIPQEAYDLGQQVGWTAAKVKARYVSYIAAGKSLEAFMEDLRAQTSRSKSA